MASQFIDVEVPISDDDGRVKTVVAAVALLRQLMLSDAVLATDRIRAAEVLLNFALKGGLR